jgi:predicted CXXCH cytochrome family protein
MQAASAAFMALAAREIARMKRSGLFIVSGAVFLVGAFGDAITDKGVIKIVLTGLRNGKAEGCGCNANTQYTISREATVLKKHLGSSGRVSTYLVDLDYDSIVNWEPELRQYFKLMQFDVAERQSLTNKFKISAGKSLGEPWHYSLGKLVDLKVASNVPVREPVVVWVNGVAVKMNPGSITVLTIHNGKVTSEGFPIQSSVVEDPIVKNLLDQKAERHRAELIGLLSKKNVTTQLRERPSSCGSCHADQYLSWSKSKHAQAMVTLEKKGRLEAECMQCHSTKVRQGGTLDITNIQLEDAVTCVSCHDPESAHRNNVNQQYKESLGANVCLSCHTQQTSPKFQFSEFKGRVHL